MRKILSLDLATELGWCIGAPGEEPVLGAHRLPSTGDDIGKFALAYDKWLRGMLDEHLPSLVAFEAPMPDSAGRTPIATSLKLKGLCWHTEYVCALYGIRCAQEGANRWKAAICGNGRVNKKMHPYPPIEALAQRGIVVTNHNAADAGCLWLFALGCVDERAAAKFDPLARRVALL